MNCLSFGGGAHWIIPFRIEKGMTFAIETQHGVPGIGGVRMEEMIHVTDYGVEIMSQWPIDEITVCEL